MLKTARIGGTVKRALLLAALLVALPYARTVIYRFPAPAVFAGDQFYNPYAGVTGAWTGAVWQKANFHVHSRAWGGATSGRQSDEDVVRAYRALGYAVPGLSNYQQISTPPGHADLQIFEHGYNLGKHHQLAIGARRVVWFDFPILQVTSHKQLIIDELAQNADLVAIAHPSGRWAYATRDMRRLTGYQLVEVVNGPFANARAWDAALSSGHAVWGFANDDGHDLEEPTRLGRSWSMLAAPTSSASDVVEALRGGHFYATLRFDHDPAAELTNIETVEFKDGTLTITCTGALAMFEFFGQDGVLKKTVRDTLTGSYTFDAADTYIRTIVWAPRHAIYLNPVLRWDGEGLPAPAARINEAATWLMRLAVVASGACVLVMRRAGSRGAAARSATSGTNEERS